MALKKWSDIDLDFTAHPNTGKLSLKTDADAVVRAVRYLLLTNHYERPFHPEFGSNLTAHLFEPMTYATTLRIKNTITEAIENFEPRVRLTDINVTALDERNEYHIKLRFFIINEDMERETEFLLERTR